MMVNRKHIIPKTDEPQYNVAYMIVDENGPFGNYKWSFETYYNLESMQKALERLKSKDHIKKIFVSQLIEKYLEP